MKTFHKNYPKDLSQKTFDTNHESGRDFGTAIGAMMGVFGWLVDLVLWFFDFLSFFFFFLVPVKSHRILALD